LLQLKIERGLMVARNFYAPMNVAALPGKVERRTRSLPLLSLENIGKDYGRTAGAPVLNRLTLNVDPGEFCAITGASGSGKSTLLNIVGLLDRPTRGIYLLAGHDVSRLPAKDAALWRNRAIGFIFQSFHLLPRFTICDNAALPLIYRGMAKDERRRAARAALERVGLGAFLDRYPDELSGGQRQRAAIARALAGNPALLLADEPTGNLDSRSAQEVVSLFAELNRDLNVTILIVTHDPVVAGVCLRQIVLKDGGIVQTKADAVAAGAMR
jgi:putative ABC transport system ATP-binding protein